MQRSEAEQTGLGFDDVFQLLVELQLLIPVPDRRILVHKLLDDSTSIDTANLPAELLPLTQSLVEQLSENSSTIQQFSKQKKKHLFYQLNYLCY